MAIIELEIIRKYNPYHGPDGRFTSGPGGGAAGGTAAGGTASAWSKQLQEEKSKLLQEKPVKQALYVYQQAGGSSRDEQFPEFEKTCIASFKNGTSEALVEDYFSIMEKNGNPAPTKQTSKQMNRELENDVREGKYKDYAEARLDYVKKLTGMNDDEANEAMSAMQQYFGGSRCDAEKTAAIDRYVEKAPAYEGEIFRGMSFSNEDYAAFMADIAPGAAIGMKGNSSWSNSKEMADVFAHRGDAGVNSVTLTCLKNRTSTPVDHISHFGENEVLAGSKTRWTILHHETVEHPNGTKKTRIAVVEEGEH